MAGSYTFLLLNLLLVAFVGASTADLLATLPDCAAICFEQILNSSLCSSSDISCLCADQTFMNTASLCEMTTCTTKEILTSTNATYAACGYPQGDVSTTILSIAASFGMLATLLTLVRVFSVQLRGFPHGWEDGLISIAALLSAVLNFVCFPMAIKGMGKDLWVIKFDDITEIFFLLYVAEVFYMAAEMFVQLSFLAFYLRVFETASSFVHRGSWVLICFVICFGTANTLTMIFQCTPVTYFWNGWSGEHNGTCININNFSWARAGIEIALDITIMALPLPSLLKLHMSWRRKLQVMIMFAVGFIITIISTLRLRSLIEFAKTSNPTYDNSPAIYWSVLECDMFIILACLPSIHALLVSVLRSRFGSIIRSNYPDGRQSGTRKYYRHDGNHAAPGGRSGGGHSGAASYQLRILGKSCNTKSVDIQASRKEKSNSDEELVLQHPGNTREI